ncbi:Alpha/Beta hydrolase protein [Aspergillus foveolatus]|uniref:Alpha/Beta hydrolase protein n=1 Tax=Aspergillus foveolatus TaxID=210207 RepID=UPI003CCE10AD
MAEYAQYSEVSPQWTQFVASQPLLADLDRVGIVERKRIFGEIEAQIPERTVQDDVTERTVTVTEFTIPACDGYPIPVRSYVPTSARPDASLRPLLIYLHAGGFLFGPQQRRPELSSICGETKHQRAECDYLLALKWPFPYGVNDSYDATACAARNSEAHLAASPNTGFLAGGISSGANLAGVIAYTARDARSSPLIRGLFISIPVCIMPQEYAAAQQNAENPLLTPKSLMDIQELYVCPPEDPRISFLLNKDQTGLSGRAYFQICGRDPLRDEAFLWQKLLAEYSGTKTRLDDVVVEGIAFLTKGEEPVQQTEVIVKS